jgi:hypothetical protein
MADTPVEEHGVDGPLKYVDGRQSLVGAEGGQVLRINCEALVIVVLLRELAAIVIDVHLMHLICIHFSYHFAQC